MKIRTRTLELSGSSYEIGAALGKIAARSETLKSAHTAALEGFGDSEAASAAALFEAWCPGLNEELRGFAEALGVPPAQLFFWGMTYLRPNCSQLALLPEMTKSGRPLAARSYEFSHEAEDFTLVRTSAAGRYAHLGTSALLFGRDEGLNECGLAVTMSSCGFPVGAPAPMRRPKLVGLQFWAVIRAVLENCKDVDEALEYLADMPIAYNLNLMLTDKGGSIALLETLDGRKAVKRISPGGGEKYLCATNHAVLPELAMHEPSAMRHSLLRYEWLRRRLDGVRDVTAEDVRQILLSDYPDGLCCRFYNEFLGTTKSMILDPAGGTVELCWGGTARQRLAYIQRFRTAGAVGGRHRAPFRPLRPLQPPSLCR